MAWIIILIPICIWLSYSILIYMNMTSLVFCLLLLLGYFIYEARMIMKHKERSGMPLIVMLELILTVAVNIVVSLIK